MRRKAVATVESGASQTEVARLFGVSRKTVGTWVSAYQRMGEESFPPKRRGRQPGDQLALRPAQQTRILETIVDGPPRRLGSSHRLWTVKAVAALVDREFRIALSPTTVAKYLVRWGLVEERRRLDAWRRGGTAPATRRRTLNGLETGGLPDAETLWVAWTRPRVSVHPHDGPVTGSRNLMPAVRGQFGDVDVLVAVPARGGVFFLAQRGAFDAEQTTEFLEQLMSQLGRRLSLVIRTWPFQHYGLIRVWSRRYPGRISIRLANA